MSLRVQILGVLGLLVLVAATEAGLVYFLQRDVRDAAAEVERATDRQLVHGRMWRALLRMESAERAYLLAGERSLLGESDAARQDYEHDIAEILALTVDPGQRERVRRVEALVTRWQQARPSDSPGHPATPEARAARGGELAARFQSIEEGLQGILARENERLAAAQASSRAHVQKAALLLMIIPIAGILVLAGLIITAQRRLLAPIGTLAAAMRQVQHGPMVVPAFAERDDEIGALFRAFRDVAHAVVRRQSEAAQGIEREQAVSTRLGELTARAEAAQAELRQIIDSMPAALIMFDAEGRVTMMNRASVSLLGDYTQTAEAQAAFRGSYTLNDRNGHRLARHQYPSARALGGERVEGLEIEIQTPDRRTLPILASAAPLLGQDGEVLGAVVGFQDITRIRDIDRLKDEFVSTVSHELRTPLTSIRGSLQLVLDGAGAVANDDHRQLLRVALANCERLIRIINDILDVSKIEAGRIQLQRRTVPVDALIRLSIQNVEQIARTGRITVVTDAPDGLPPVFADADRFVQALVNLLSNAVKFAPAGTTVRVAAAARGPVVAITVKDQGPGIPPEHMDRLFQKFQQLDSSASRRTGGTGLGLAIAKAIVEQHGGRITVQSALGVGTTFTITVPIAPPRAGRGR